MRLKDLDNLPALLGVKAASALTGVNPRTVQAFCKSGRWKAALIGGRWLVNTAALLKECGLADEEEATA